MNGGSDCFNVSMEYLLLFKNAQQRVYLQKLICIFFNEKVTHENRGNKVNFKTNDVVQTYKW